MTAAILLATLGVALLAALWLSRRWLDRRLDVDLTDTEPPEVLPIFDAALQAIRERGAMVADGEFLP